MNLIDRDKLIMHIADCQLSESITWEEAELFTDFLLNSPVIKTQMNEEVREALMRLTMCAREECQMCKYEKECGYDMQCELATKNMQIILKALRGEGCLWDSERNGK